MKPSFTESFRDKLMRHNPSLYSALVATEDKLPVFWERSSPGTYTSHGKAHIESVEYYVDKLIGEERLKEMSADEYFILLLGVFCHDIGMMEGRELHNVFSYKFVIDEKTNRDIIVPDCNYYKPIAMLCLGHRDYENNKGQKIHTLTTPCEIDEENVAFTTGKTRINHEDVHLQYLAAILRLADELDVTDIRSPQNVFRYYECINRMPPDAKEHWQKGAVIKDVDITSSGSVTSIRLIPNTDNIRKLSGNDPVLKDGYLKIIFSVKDKIEKEIEQINPITFSDPLIVDDKLAVRFDIDIQYDENDFISKEDYNEYKRVKEKEQREKNFTNSDYGIDTSDSRSAKQNEIGPPRITLSKIIEEFRRDRNLLETGRFMYSFEEKEGNKKENEEDKKKDDKKENEYTQFFINTQLLLTNRDALNSITDIFEEQFNGKEIDCVIGIGKAGIILAPNLSLKLKCDSTYVICGWEGSSSVNWEKDISVIKDAKNVLVLLDVISTGTATRKGIEKIKEIKEKTGSTLGNIYIGTIFCTNKKIVEELEREDKVKEMYYIRDDFQFKTYKYEEYMRPENEEFRKGLELLPIRKK